MSVRFPGGSKKKKYKELATEIATELAETA
jgi:hypothetical protein